MHEKEKEIKVDDKSNEDAKKRSQNQEGKGEINHEFQRPSRKDEDQYCNNICRYIEKIRETKNKF